MGLLITFLHLLFHFLFQLKPIIIVKTAIAVSLVFPSSTVPLRPSGAHGVASATSLYLIYNFLINCLFVRVSVVNCVLAPCKYPLKSLAVVSAASRPLTSPFYHTLDLLGWAEK